MKTLKLVWWASALVFLGGCPRTVTVPNAHVRGDATVGDDARVGDDLYVGGRVDVGEGGNIGGVEIDEDGNVNIPGDLNVLGDINSAGDVSAGDDLVGEDLYVDNEPVVGPPGEIDHDDDPETDPVCPEHQRLCPDGTIVYRVPPDCEFEECPVVPVDNDNENGNDNTDDNENDNDNGNDNGNENDNTNGNENENDNESSTPVITWFALDPDEVEPGESFDFELSVADGDGEYLFTCLFPDGNLLTEEDDGVEMQVVGNETDFFAEVTVFPAIDPEDFITATLPVYCQAMSDGKESLMATEFITVVGSANGGSANSKSILWIWRTPQESLEFLSRNLRERASQ